MEGRYNAFVLSTFQNPKFTTIMKNKTMPSDILKRAGKIQPTSTSF